MLLKEGDFMEDVFSILEALEQTSSRNAKKAILQKNKDNELLKKVFLYAYNPRWIYGIGEKSIKKKKVKTTSQQTDLLAYLEKSPTFKTIFDLLDELKKHPFGSDSDVQAVNDFLSKCNDLEFKWYSRIILKDLKIGATAKTINKVFPNLIPEFTVMLAYPYKENGKARPIDKLFMIQQKLDGYRFVVYHHPDGSVQFFTRNGVQLFDFPEIEAEFKKIKPQVVTTVFDGELIANDKFNDTQKLVMRKEPKTGLVYNVFDVITIDEFERGESVDDLFTRYNLLQHIIPSNLTFIKVVPELYRGDDISQISKWFQYAKSMSWEGIMVKINAPYVRKRTANMLKVKEFDTLDLKVLKVNEGTGKYVGRLGSVTVDFEGQEVDIGSGFTDYDRELFWRNPNLILDKYIEVQYFEITTNQNGTRSLRFPVFKRIREDK